MLGYGNLSNYGPSWWEWGGGAAGSDIRDYPCTGTDTDTAATPDSAGGFCDPNGDVLAGCP